MSMAWIPKSTVPATLAGVIYTESLALGDAYKDIQTYGLQIQTTCILAICVCEPVGSFLIDQFAPKYLTIDPSDPAYIKNIGDDVEKKEADFPAALEADNPVALKTDPPKVLEAIQVESETRSNSKDKDQN